MLMHKTAENRSTCKWWTVLLAPLSPHCGTFLFPSPYLSSVQSPLCPPSSSTLLTAGTYKLVRLQVFLVHKHWKWPKITFKAAVGLHPIYIQPLAQSFTHAFYTLWVLHSHILHCIWPCWALSEKYLIQAVQEELETKLTVSSVWLTECWGHNW